MLRPMSGTPHRPKGISGRKFVPAGLAVIAAAVIGLMVLFFQGPRGNFTRDTAGPRGAVASSIEATCDGASVRETGKCPVNKRLTVTAVSKAPDAKYVTWALFGPGGVVVRSSPVGAPVEFELAALSPGGYMVAAVVGDQALDTKSLPARFGGEDAKVEASRGLDVVEVFANDARKAGRAATVTRLPIVLEPAPAP